MKAKNGRHMYTVAVSREFTAGHYLIGGDWGAENDPHDHFYKVEVRLSGPVLDRHGYLADIDDISRVLAARVNYFQNRLLNRLPEFEALNPSIEHFARILCESIAAEMNPASLTCLAVRIWENEAAWAEYRIELE